MRKPREEWRASFEMPRFTDVTIAVRNSEVRVWAVPYHQEEHFHISLDELRISTSPARTLHRLPDTQQRRHSGALEYVWEMLVLIQVRNA